MASRVTLNHFDLLSHDEQAALAVLLDKPLEETLTDDKNQGWFVRPSPHAFVNPYNFIQPLTLATNLVELCKTTYSVIVLNGKNGSGNSCGHDPDNPRFVMKHHAYFAKQEIDDLGAKRRPQILYDIVERVKAYYYDPDVMPVIQLANSHRRSSDRQRRSESRESLISLLSVMIMNMDLSSLRVGQPMRNGGFFNYSIEWLAEKAKLSVSRAKRAISDLNNAMLIASYQYRELIDKEKKEYIAHNAARVFDMDFFRMLQIDLQKFGRARKISYQKQKDKQAQANESAKEMAVSSLNMKKMMNMIDPQDNTLKSVNLSKSEDERRQENRCHKRRTQIFLQLRDDPRYQDNEAAFDQALRQRLANENLLSAAETAETQQEAAT